MGATLPHKWSIFPVSIAQTGAPDADYELLKEQFDETEIGNLTLGIGRDRA